MSTGEKTRGGAATSTNHRANVTSSAGTSRGTTFLSPQSVISSTGTQPPVESDNVPDPYSDWDVFTRSTGRPTNSLSPTPSSIAQNSKVAISGSTLLQPALQLAYDRGAELATMAECQIVADKAEVVNIIANYAVEPSEMLHLVDRWLQQLLNEFKQQRDKFKYRLSEKWQNGQLTNIAYDNNDRIRQIHSAYVQLEKARNDTFSRESFDTMDNYLRRTDDSETDQMKQKFKSLAEEYLKIVHCLEFVDRETRMSGDGVDNYLSNVKDSIVKLQQMNSKQSHTICIVGLEKAGKSTFINALLGFELVPTAAQRCTQVRTVLKPPLQHGDRQLFATMEFYSDEEFKRFYEKMIKKTDESQQQFDERKRQVGEERETLRTKFPREDFFINNLSDVERERTNICKKLYDYITGEVYCNIIRQIEIYTDKLPGKNYELLDVPGFDSPIKEHRDAGLEAVRTADAFLFLTNGQQPSLTQPQIRLIHEIQQNHFEAMQRAFGIITKLDLCSTPAIYRDHHDKGQKELIEKKFKPEHIYVACPRLQILKESSEEYQVINEKLRHFGNDLAQGFERSKEGLNRFIQYELPKTHLKQLVELGRTRLLPAALERMDRVKEKQLLPENLGDMSIDQYIEQQKNESWDQVYNDQIFKPAFDNANYWHAKTVTKERATFINDVRQTFYDAFLLRTKQFLQSTEEIERQMFERYDYSKLQLNAHPVEDIFRGQLSFKLEAIVDETSDVLARHFYHQYICGLENILISVCPHLKDLFSTRLTLEKCINEVHALVLRVTRPIITAVLRYSHLDPVVKMNAINELIYIAPTVAYNIASTSNQTGSTGAVASDIYKSVETLASQNETTTLIIRTLFSK